MPGHNAPHPMKATGAPSPAELEGEGLPLLCFTVDTEPDDLWDQRGKPTLEHFAQLPAFHELITSAGARPTYLTTSEVVEDPSALRSLLHCWDTGTCEIGAHFHTWTRSWPFPVPDLGSPPLHAMAHQLGAHIEGQMLRYTCDAIAAAIGEAPRSYRGGRWSLGAETVASLAACGITVDSTVTPGQSWRQWRASPLLDGPDFTRAPRSPYFLACGEDVTVARNVGEVLELPVGAAWTPRQARALSGSGLMQKVMRRLSGVGLGYTWLRPTLQSDRQLSCCLRQLKSDAIPVWVSIIHSSELLPSHHLPTPEAVAAFVRRCVAMVEAAIDLGARPCTLQEAAAHFLAGQRQVARPEVTRRTIA